MVAVIAIRCRCDVAIFTIKYVFHIHKPQCHFLIVGQDLLNKSSQSTYRSLSIFDRVARICQLSVSDRAGSEEADQVNVVSIKLSVALDDCRRCKILLMLLSLRANFTLLLIPIG